MIYQYKISNNNSKIILRLVPISHDRDKHNHSLLIHDYYLITILFYWIENDSFKRIQAIML